MPDFSQRSIAMELLDDPAISFEDIKRNMQELNTVNTLLGGHRITLKGLKILAEGRPRVSVCEIGCGGGDNLAAIAEWCLKQNIKVDLRGVDINKNCIAFARQKYPGIQFISSDYRKLQFENKPDIIFNSLFCHHFSNNEITDMLLWMKQNAKAGFFINDLERHPFAYYSIKNITRLFSKSYLVKNDAPLSVLRGFKKHEWTALLNQAHIQANISREWAFRHLIVCKNEA